MPARWPEGRPASWLTRVRLDRLLPCVEDAPSNEPERSSACMTFAIMLCLLTWPAAVDAHDASCRVSLSSSLCRAQPFECLLDDASIRPDDRVNSLRLIDASGTEAVASVVARAFGSFVKDGPSSLFARRRRRLGGEASLGSSSLPGLVQRNGEPSLFWPWERMPSPGLEVLSGGSSWLPSFNSVDGRRSLRREPLIASKSVSHLARAILVSRLPSGSSTSSSASPDAPSLFA